jgi:arsenate reductase (glutaredoxin)
MEEDMNIQIFGSGKCYDTKKAERYFKERGIKFQSIDVGKFGMSKGEFNNVKQAVGGLEALLDTDSRDKELLALIRYLSPEDKEAKLLENPKLFRTPIVRNGKKATVGYQPEVWKNWE